MSSRIQLLIGVTLTAIISAAVGLAGCDAPPPAPPVTLRIGVFQTQDDQTQKVLLRAGVQQRPVDTRRLYDETLLAEVLKERR